MNAVTLAQVTADAGLHPSGIRRYFDSREELLLELAQDGWVAWSQSLVENLKGRRELVSERIVDAIVETLTAQPLFCDLITHVPVTLEDGVGRDRAIEYKTAAFAAYDEMVNAIAEASATLTAGAAQDLLVAALGLTSYLWQVAHPGPVLASIYVDVPEWGHAAASFRDELRRLLTHVAVGAGSRR